MRLSCNRQVVTSLTKKNRLKVGVTGIYYRFNHPYEPDLKKYAKYNLHGNDFYNLGVDYKYRWGKLVWVGEGAVGKQGYALLNQLKYRLLTGYQLLLIHRCYSHDYWSFFGRRSAREVLRQNENGWYLATEAAPWAHGVFASWICSLSLVEVSYQQGFAGNRRNVSGCLFSAEKLIAISQLPV